MNNHYNKWNEVNYLFIHFLSLIQSSLSCLFVTIYIFLLFLKVLALCIYSIYKLFPLFPCIYFCYCCYHHHPQQQQHQAIWRPTIKKRENYNSKGVSAGQNTAKKRKRREKIISYSRSKKQISWTLNLTKGRRSYHLCRQCIPKPTKWQ